MRTDRPGLIGQSVIRRALPHRFPMLLVDRVLDVLPGERITAVKAVTCNEPWYREVAADTEDFAYPQVLLMESWCQAAGLLATWEAPNPDVLAGRVMLFGAVTGLEYHRPVLPGDVLEHRATITRTLGDTLIIAGESLVDGEPVLTVGSAVLAFRPAEELRPVPA
ncbi:3-hydroxyacyl-ACP dehydratase FabZ family protein [Kitasatospora aureofaciens]|uniref:3-hydroxyacyl-ACP dehydratase FabZ family protein n=1 Tax=Kitasatospora aureofaciens TaxID=1894 RepID=UPI001C45023D|nr:beta-hydroxyacyl-ACP dehydratase [Kitasatospora aureofaciens]MBV6698119.1 beta-hydroxyacyl-ACP dehydratase [Kitasatospora aureofaciens]